MMATTDPRLAQVQRYGTSLRRLCKFLFGMTALGSVVLVLVLIFGSSENTTLSIGRIEYSADTVTAPVRILVIVTVLLATALVLKLLFHLIRLFDLYASGRIFTPENVRHLRTIGVTVFLFLSLWLLDLVAQLIVPQHATSPSTTDAHSLYVSFNYPFGVVILGIVIVFFSWIMDVGRELREEQDLVV